VIREIRRDLDEVMAVLEGRAVRARQPAEDGGRRVENRG